MIKERRFEQAGSGSDDARSEGQPALLVQQYGTVPGTVERAVDVLKAEGYLKTVLGRGLFVTEPGERTPPASGFAAGQRG